MTRSFLIIIFIATLLIHIYPPEVYCQIAEIASLVTSILGGAGNGAAIGNAAAAGAGAANAIGNLGALYQLAQTAMQLTGTGVGIANQAAESQWFPVVVEQAAKNHRMMTERLAAFNSGRIVNPLSLGGTDGFGGVVTSYYKSTTESTLPSEYGSKIVITETTEYPKTSKSKPALTKVDKEDNVDEYEEEDKDKSGSGNKKDEEYEEEISNRIDVDNSENIDGLNEKLIKNENKNVKSVESSQSKENSGKSKSDEDDGNEESVETLKKLMKILKKSNLDENEFAEIAKQLTKSTKKDKKVDSKVTTTSTTTLKPTTTQKSTTTQKLVTTDESDYTSEERAESEERRRIIEETKRSLGRRTTIFQRITSLNPKHATLIRLISTTPLPDSEKIFPIPLSQAIKHDNNKPGEIIEKDKFLTTTIETPVSEKTHIILVKPEPSMYKDPQGGIPIESVKKTSKRIFTATIPIIHENDRTFTTTNQFNNHLVSNHDSSKRIAQIYQQKQTSNIISEHSTLQQINRNIQTQQPVRTEGRNEPYLKNAHQSNLVRFNGATTFNSNTNMPLQITSGVNVPYQQNYNNRQSLPYPNNFKENNKNFLNGSPQIYNSGVNNYQQRTTIPSQGYHQINVPYNSGIQQPYKASFNQQQQQQWRGYNNNYQQNQYYQSYNQNNVISNNNNINPYINNQQFQRGVWRNGR